MLGFEALGRLAIGEVSGGATAVNMSAGAPVFGTPVLVRNIVFVAVDLVDGLPVFSLPAFKQQHVLQGAWAPVSPVIGAPLIAQSHALAATSFAVAVLSLGQPTIGQTHVIVAVPAVSGVPAFGAATLGVIGIMQALPLWVSSPTINIPAFNQSQKLTATPLVAGAPVLAAAPYGNVFAAVNLSVPPIFVVVIIHEINLLSTANLATGPPVEAAAVFNQSQALAAIAPAPTPVLGAPVFTQKQVLVAAFTLSPPVFSVPAFAQVHVFVAGDLVVAPVLPTATLTDNIADLVLGDRALDYGLAAFAEVDKILVCTYTPVSYMNAFTVAVGESPVSFGAPQPNAGGGRKVTGTAVVSGSVYSTGTPHRWAAVDTINTRLIAHGDITGDFPVNPSTAWTLQPITVVQSGVPIGFVSYEIAQRDGQIIAQRDAQIITNARP